MKKKNMTLTMKNTKMMNLKNGKKEQSGQKLLAPGLN